MNIKQDSQRQEEDSVESLMAKLAQKGTKVKIVKEGEDEFQRATNILHTTPADEK